MDRSRKALALISQTNFNENLANISSVVRVLGKIFREFELLEIDSDILAVLKRLINLVRERRNRYRDFLKRKFQLDERARSRHAQALVQMDSYLLWRFHLPKDRQNQPLRQQAGDALACLDHELTQLMTKLRISRIQAQASPKVHQRDAKLVEELRSMLQQAVNQIFSEKLLRKLMEKGVEVELSTLSLDYRLAEEGADPLLAKELNLLVNLAQLIQVALLAVKEVAMAFSSHGLVSRPKLEWDKQ